MKTAKPTKKEAPVTGSNSLMLLLQTHRKGASLHEASEDLAEIVKAVKETGNLGS